MQPNTPTHRRKPNPVSTYNNGQPYHIAKGHSAPIAAVVDRFASVHPIVSGFPTAAEFMVAFVRELKIRCYQPNTIKSYRNVLKRFLLWFGNSPHKVTREDVRCYFEDLVDGGAKSDYISQNLAVIRTAFDKFNGRQVTLGLATPRRPKRMPIILSQNEVRRILEAASSLRDKLFIGLMYATGMRISEVTKLRWSDFDFDRRTVSIWQAKGKSDRQVTLPESYAPLLRRLSGEFHASDFVFPGEKSGRHISPRTGERIVSRTTQLADIRKKVTPHSFRHAFATHLLEHGTDIRFIQKLLGHVRLETTTIYTKVAVLKQTSITSPLDRVIKQPPHERPVSAAPAVGRMKLHIKMIGNNSAAAEITITSHTNSDHPVTLDGIIVQESRPGWVIIALPPAEDWEAKLCLLDAKCRQRMNSPEFFQLVQQQLSRRYLSLQT